jgi:hypothetical protein
MIQPLMRTGVTESSFGDAGQSVHGTAFAGFARLLGDTNPLHWARRSARHV